MLHLPQSKRSNSPYMNDDHPCSGCEAPSTPEKAINLGNIPDYSSLHPGVRVPERCAALQADRKGVDCTSGQLRMHCLVQAVCLVLMESGAVALTVDGSS